MASAVVEETIEIVKMAEETIMDLDSVDLAALSGLIESFSKDGANGEEGIEGALRNLFACLRNSCEKDKLALFQTILSCIDCTEMVACIETELLRSCVLNRSFRCARFLVHQVQSVNLCSVIRWMCISDWDAVTFKTLVDRGFSITDCACKGVGALKRCIFNGNEDLVQVCLQNGCSPNSLNEEHTPDDDHSPEVAVDEFSPLMCAVFNANAGIVEKLLEFGADLTIAEKCGMSTLEAAVYSSKSKETALIVKAYQKILKTNPENRNLFENDVQKSFTNAVEMKYSAVVEECMQVLISAGADVNNIDQRGCTPLVLAIDANEPETVAFLLGNGCDINTTGNIPDGENSESFRQVLPLDMACNKSDMSILSLLLKAGVVIGPNVFDNEVYKKRIIMCWKSFTLADWCRVAIRQYSKVSSLETHVKNLELPTTLKHFLTMCY